MGMNKNSSSKLILFLVIGLLMGYRYVQSSTNQQSSGTSTYHQIEAANQQEEDEFERIKIEKKEELDKVYGNGLYLEDVEEISKIYEEKYINYLENILSEVDIPFAIEADVEFYTSTLKLAKEESITFEEAMSHPGEHIRTISISISGFDEPSKFMRLKYKGLHDTLHDLWKSYDDDDVKETQILWSIYDKSILDVTNLLDIKESESQLVYLDRFKNCLYRNIIMVDAFDSYKEKLDNSQEDLDVMTNALKRKYNEEFIGIINLNHEGPSLCAPVEDVSLYFETGIEPENRHQVLEDKYVSLLVEKKLRAEVDKILEEVGLDKNVVPVVIPMDGDDYMKLTYRVDQPNKLETFELINGYFDTDICVTLHYVTLENEEIDYEKIRCFYKRLRKCFDFYEAANTGTIFRQIDQFAYFYNVGSRDIKDMIISKDKKEYYSSRLYNNKPSLGNIWTSLYRTEDDSDKYLLIPVYGEKQKYILKMVLEDDSSQSLEEFIKYSTEENKL